MRTTFLWSAWATWKDLDSSTNEKNYWITSITLPHSEIHNAFNMKECLPIVCMCVYKYMYIDAYLYIYTYFYMWTFDASVCIFFMQYRCKTTHSGNSLLPIYSPSLVPL